MMIDKNEKLKYAIVVIGYNRIDSIKRLIKSIIESEYNNDDEIDLIVSIDKSIAEDNIVHFLEPINWTHGRKRIRTFETRQGLRKHVIQCGDYANEYDAIIVLEDDLVVSSYFFSYVKQAIEFYSFDDNIAGISLYKHLFHPGVNRPFEPANNGYDAYLMQFAQSWGQCWTKKMWSNFKNWYDGNISMSFLDCSILPEYICQWNEQSWLKYFIKYVVEKNKYFVYPMISLTTNVSEIGEHNCISNNIYQVPLLEGHMNFRFPTFKDAIKYDVYFERIDIKKNIFLEYSGNKIIDLYGSRNNFKGADYIFSIQELPYKKINSFSLQYRPIEENLLRPTKGNEIFLYDLHKKARLKKQNDSYITKYDVKGIPWRRLLRLVVTELNAAVKEKIKNHIKI